MKFLYKIFNLIPGLHKQVLQLSTLVIPGNPTAGYFNCITYLFYIGKTQYIIYLSNYRLGLYKRIINQFNKIEDVKIIAYRKVYKGKDRLIKF